jgi:hypothetical protein
MNTIIIDNKKYVVVEQEIFENLQAKAASKTTQQKKLSLATGKKHAYKLIDKWAKGK